MKVKTNAMRQLDKKKLEYQVHDYSQTEALSGVEVAQVLHQDPGQVFKTLVTVGKSRDYFVFVIPVVKELDLKKAAKAVGEKAVEMVKSKELLGLTGYVHGGCSPIGMKKQFQTIVHVSAKSLERLIFSGGKIGYQIETTLENLQTVVPLRLEDVIKTNENE